MGFFDSFSKKKEGGIAQPAMGALPPPAAIGDMPLPPPKLENSDLPLPPPAHSGVFELSPVQQDMPPMHEDLPQPNISMPPPPMEKAPEFQPVQEQPSFMPLEIPAVSQQKDTPDELPVLSLPKGISQGRTTYATELPDFSESGTEHIPAFPEMETSNAILDELPVLSVDEKKPYFDFKYQNLKKPIFVRTDYYTDILTNIDSMKNYAEESLEVVYSLENLKKNTDAEHRAYKRSLEDIQRKLVYVDKVLFNP